MNEILFVCVCVRACSTQILLVGLHFFHLMLTLTEAKILIDILKINSLLIYKNKMPYTKPPGTLIIIFPCGTKHVGFAKLVLSLNVLYFHNLSIYLVK